MYYDTRVLSSATFSCGRDSSSMLYEVFFNELGPKGISNGSCFVNPCTFFIVFGSHLN